MKKSRTLLTTLTAALAALTLAACGGTSTTNDAGTTPDATGTGDAPAATQVIRAGSTGQSYPNGYKEGDKLIGFDVELLETAAERAGYTVAWTTADFAGLMGQLEAGRLDTVANNVAITPQREETYDFTDIYAYMGAAIVTQEGSDIQTLQDLQGRTVSGVLGSNNLKTLEAWASEAGVGIEVRPYETRDGAMADTINGRVDGYIQSTGILLAEINKEGLPLRFVGDPIGVDQIAMPFAKTDEGAALREAISAEFEAMKEDGTLVELSEKYYGADVTQPIEVDSSVSGS